MRWARVSGRSEKSKGQAADGLVNLVIDDHPERIRSLPVILGHFGGGDASFLSVPESIGRLETDRIAELVLADSTRTVSQLVLLRRAGSRHSPIAPSRRPLQPAQQRECIWRS